MANKKGGSGAKPDEATHEKARELAEGALDRMADGDEKAADALIERSKEMDPTAAAEVVAELEEDAGSDPEAGKKAGG